MDEQESILKEFLVECSEGLGRLDQEFVALEQEPTDTNLLASIFRTIHTIKGTCGFLGLGKLENVAHRAENVLSQMRDQTMAVTPDRVSVLLEAVDVIKEIIGQLESSGQEPEKEYPVYGPAPGLPPTALSRCGGFGACRGDRAHGRHRQV